MKYIFFLFFLCSLNAQEAQNDTIVADSIKPVNEPVLNYPDNSPIYENGQKIIYFNPRKNVSIFFPQPIRQGITGSENVTFTYNTEKPQFFGLLKGIKSSDSNLLIITTDGQVYSFLLRYDYNIPNQNYFIDVTESIGNEDPTYQAKVENKDEMAINESALKPAFEERNYDPNFSDFETVNYMLTPRDTSYLYYNTDRLDFMRKYCSNLSQRLKSKGLSVSDNDIKLTLLSINYKYNEMYFTMEIENNSGVDYDLNLLDISVANNRKRKRKSAQTILKKPIFTYQLLSRIPRKSTKRIVYVLPKFSINDEKKVIIELNEFAGERNLILDIPQRNINNPD